MGNNLKKLRDDARLTHAEAAERMGISRSQFIKLERGERRLTADYIRLAAKAFGVPDSRIITRSTVPVVGYAKAGAEIEILHADGQGPFDEVDAPDDATETTVAVQIDGDCMGPLLNGWLAFYDDEPTAPTSAMIGQICVVWLMDGRVLLKKLTKGDRPNTFTLGSQFDPPLYDQLVKWAAPITNMRPR